MLSDWRGGAKVRNIRVCNKVAHPTVACRLSKKFVVFSNEELLHGLCWSLVQ